MYSVHVKQFLNLASVKVANIFLGKIVYDIISSQHSIDVLSRYFIQLKENHIYVRFYIKYY